MKNLLSVHGVRLSAPTPSTASWSEPPTSRHDRAVFHFLTDSGDRERYAEVPRSALRPRGKAVIATFAADGPTTCSGLPVARYSADELVRVLGAPLTLLATDREQHHTPGGSIQPFTWVVLDHDPSAREPESLPSA
jgi:hypothetical protein